jgi:DNA-directed RNA polymerase subunit RPC12/RpoP
MADAYLCTTCGTQFTESDSPPAACPVCQDERQYIGRDGQQWTTLAELRQQHRNQVAPEAGVLGIGTEPHFAIGQRALLVGSRAGNVLWDCISLIDEATVQAVRERGGLAAIAISHPHYYTSMVEWSRAFGGVPIYLHEDDREWVMRPDPAIVFWRGEQQQISPTLTLVRCGGHFEGGTVLHQQSVADDPATLYCGDIITVVPDRRYVSFMRSYPNYIPLNAAAVQRIAAAVEPFEFERLYGAFWGDVIFNDAKGAVRRSVERYVQAIAGA